MAEVLARTTEIRQMIVERRGGRSATRPFARGCSTCATYALLKVAQGVTCMEEVVRRIPMEYLLPED